MLAFKPQTLKLGSRTIKDVLLSRYLCLGSPLRGKPCQAESAAAIKDKVCLVTGGSLGIGQSCAKELLNCGAKGVMIADYNVAEGKKTVDALNKEFSNRAEFISCDVTKPDQLEGSYKATIDKWKGLDIILLNAGIVKESAWERCIAININHCVRGSLLAFKYIGKNNGGKGGVVINVASILGLQHFTGIPVYVGTKHFLIGFDRSIGTDYFYNQTGVKFLTLCPGVTLTPLIDAAHGEEDSVFPGFPGLAQILSDGLKSLPPQSSDDCGRHFAYMIAKGGNGSIWVSEGGEVYEVIIPARQTLRKK